jgi:hypothetical protein
LWVNGIQHVLYHSADDPARVVGSIAVKVVSGAESGGLKTFLVRQNNRAKYFADQLVGGGLELQ